MQRNTIGARVRAWIRGDGSPRHRVSRRPCPAPLSSPQTRPYRCTGRRVIKIESSSQRGPFRSLRVLVPGVARPVVVGPGLSHWPRWHPPPGGCAACAISLLHSNQGPVNGGSKMVPKTFRRWNHRFVPQNSSTLGSSIWDPKHFDFGIVDV